MSEPPAAIISDACADCAVLERDVVVVIPTITMGALGMTYTLPAEAVTYWKHVVVAHRDHFDRMVELCRDANAQGIGVPRDVDGSFLVAGYEVGARYRLEPGATGPSS